MNDRGVCIGMEKISVHMIVKNEERCIIRCLSSVIDCVDEVVIVDTGSTDSTISLIEEFRKNRTNISLYNYEWNDDFSLARNYALSKTNFEWKFMIDADEFIHPDDISRVRELFAEASSSGHKNILCDIEYINIENYEIKSIFDMGVVRVFKGDFSYEGKVHEEPKSLSGIGVRIKMPIRIFHDGYDPNVVNTVKKHLRNVGILEHCLKEDPENYMNYIYFARETSNILPEISADYLRKAEFLYKKSGDKNLIVEDFLKITKESIGYSD